MNGIVEVRADLTEIQRATERAHAALRGVRLARVSVGRPVRGIENVTRVAASAAATLFVAVIAHMAD